MNGISYKSVKKRLNAYFKDCDELLHQINKGAIDKYDIEEIVKYYNTNCHSK